MMDEAEQKAVDLERMERQLSWLLRNMTSNLMRISRGAGKTYELVGQLQEVVSRLEAYRALEGHEIQHSLFGEWLYIGEEPDGERFADAQIRLRQYGIERMVKGGVQMAASRLVGQNTQQAAGLTELMEGMRAAAEATR